MLYIFDDIYKLGDIIPKILKNMRILIIILIIFTSCQNKNEAKSNKTPYESNSNLVENSEIKNNQEEKFLKIPYSLRYNYLDSLGVKINPNKNYEYWQYATYYQGYGDQQIKYTILKQGGDTLQRKKIMLEQYDS